MEEEKLNLTFKQKFEYIGEKLNLFTKTLKIQFIILSMWIIATILLIYYIIYDQSTYDLVEHSILPADNTWMLILAFSLIGGGGGLLFLPADPAYYEKEIFIRSIPTVLEDINQSLSNQDFTQVSQKVEEQLERLHEFHVETRKGDFLELMRKAQINNYCQEKAQIINDLLKNGNFSQAQTDYAQFTRFLNKNYPLLMEDQITIYDELASKFTL